MTKPNTRAKDSLALPAALLFWAVLGWIAYDASRALLALRASSDQINAAVAIHNNGNSRTAADAMLTVQRQALPQISPPMQALLAKLYGPDLGVSQRLASMYAGLGHWHNDRQEAEATIQAYTLALAYNPALLNSLAEPLAQACFFRKNHTLGLLVCEQIPPSQRQGTLAKLTTYFRRHQR